MDDYTSYLITIYYESGRHLIKCALKVKRDSLPDMVLKHPMDPFSRQELAERLPEHVRSCGFIVGVEEIFEVESREVKKSKPQKHYLNVMQRDLFDWDKKNFGDQPSYRSLLGATEEIGELAHAHLKEEQGIRESNYEEDAKDAIGDTIIYLANYCNARGFNLQGILEETWNQVRERDWIKYPKTGRPEEKDQSPLSFKEYCKTKRNFTPPTDLWFMYITDYLATFISFENRAIERGEMEVPDMDGGTS